MLDVCEFCETEEVIKPHYLCPQCRLLEMLNDEHIDELEAALDNFFISLRELIRIWQGPASHAPATQCADDLANAMEAISELDIS